MPPKGQKKRDGAGGAYNKLDDLLVQTTEAQSHAQS